MSIGNSITVLAPKSSEVVNISSTDHTFTSPSIVALHNATSAGGTVVAQLMNDATSRPWFIPAGGYVYGCFKKVIKAGTTLTAASAIIGVTGIYDAPAGS